MTTAKIVDTVTVQICLGLRVGYSVAYWDDDNVRTEIANYVNEANFGVTVTDTEFIYPGGREPGLIIGLINYPRFPSDYEETKRRALALAEYLLIKYEQYRVSVILQDKTIMLERKDD